MPQTDPAEHSPTPGDTSLEEGPIRVLGRLRGSSNATFLVNLGSDDDLAVYKPATGEQPLWDFPPGLWRREIAAFELADSMGSRLVPPTVHRTDGPYGEGSLQRFVPARFDEHYFTILPTASQHVIDQFRRLCVFDLVANSADRKAGHCLIDLDDRVWAIDNGLTFHTELKVRTVIWDFAGETIMPVDLDSLSVLCDEGLSDRVARWLTDEEVEATVERARWLAGAGVFPHDPTGRRHPWPLV